MSGSAGGNRIPRSAVEKTVKEYITDIYDKKNIDTINYINNNGY